VCEDVRNHWTEAR